MRTISLLTICLLTSTSCAFADKVIISLHGIGEESRASARYVAGKIGLSEAQFAQTTQDEGLALPINGETHYYFNPRAMDIVGHSNEWFPTSPGVLEQLSPERAETIWRQLTQLMGKYDITTLGHRELARLMVYDDFAEFFRSIVQEEVGRVSTYIDETLARCGCSYGDLTLAGVSQGGIMAHAVAANLGQPINRLVMSICVSSPFQFGATHLPNRIFWINGADDPIFPPDLTRQMYDLQGADFESRCDLKIIPGIGHTIRVEPMIGVIKAVLLGEIDDDGGPSGFPRVSVAPGSPDDFTPFGYFVANQPRLKALVLRELPKGLTTIEDELTKHFVRWGQPDSLKYERLSPADLQATIDRFRSTHSFGERLPEDWTPLGYFSHNTLRLQALVRRTQGGPAEIVRALAEHYVKWGNKDALRYK